MKSPQKFVLLLAVVLLFGQAVAEDGKEKIGKLTESKEVPSSQKMVTDSLAQTRDELKAKAQAIKDHFRLGCTYGYCGGIASCCDGYHCGSDNYCAQNCESRTCYHPDECCEGYYCNEGRCESYCSTSYCGHGEECCNGYYCDGYMCQQCSTTYCGHGEACCDGYHCDGYMCQQCSTTYCGHGEVCCGGYTCDGYMCRSSN